MCIFLLTVLGFSGDDICCWLRSVHCLSVRLCQGGKINQEMNEHLVVVLFSHNIAQNTVFALHHHASSWGFPYKFMFHDMCCHWQVVLQRAMLLAKCLAIGPADTWRHDFVKLMLSPQGEFIQTKAGVLLLTPVHNGPAEPPAKWSSQHKQLAIADIDGFCKVRSQASRGPQTCDA